MQKYTQIKNKDGKVIRRRVQTINEEPSMTEQQFAQDADANYIMAKYLKTGISPFKERGGYYADVSEIPDLSHALQTVTKATEMFNSLDSDIRARFGNDPSQLLQYIEKPENYEEGIKLGIFTPPDKGPAPIEVIVKNPTEPTIPQK